MAIDSFNLGTSGMAEDLARKIYFMLHGAQDNMIARAGGGQSNATPITAILSRFTTVGTNGDSAVLPPAVPGRVIVKNDGSHTLATFPQFGEKLNTTKNSSFMLNAQQCCMFVCFTAGEWHSLASA